MMSLKTRLAFALFFTSMSVAACEQLLLDPISQCKFCQEDLKACNAAAEKKFTDPVLIGKEKDNCKNWFKGCADAINGLTCSASLEQNRPTRFAAAPLMSVPAVNEATGHLDLASATLAILSNRESQIIPVKGEVSCRYVCDQSSPLCTKLDGGNSYYSQLLALRSLVSNAKDLVAKSDVMAVFGETEDPCQRSDILVLNGRFENRGVGECNARGELSFLGVNEGTKVPVELTFPAVMRGEIIRDAQGVGARFDPESAPLILLNDDPTQVLSGPVSSIEIYKNAILVEVGGACVLTSADG